MTEGETRIHQVLVVIPCGRRKIWDRQPDYGPVPARDAYTSPTFRLNRAYAEQYGDRWLVLSAKYGLIPPDYIIPGPYNVTFSNRATGPIGVDELREQVARLDLAGYDRVIALGGKRYRFSIEQAFTAAGVDVVAPFAGQPIGKYMQAVKRSLAEN